MEFFVISVLNGLTYGMLLFMVSAGLTLIFGMMGVLNFAHASFYMLGAYIGYTASKLGSFWAGLVFATLIVAILGMITERYLLRKVHSFGHSHQLLITFGIAFVIEEMIKLFYGNYPVDYSPPSELRFSAFTVFDSTYPFYRIFIALVAAAMLACLWLLVSKTRIGLVVRASERLPSMAAALGHNVPVVFTGVFGVGAALAGLAGAVAGAFYPTNPNMAVELGVIVFVVVVVGGLGSLMGSFVGSLLIGLFTSFAVGLDWSIASSLAVFGLGEWAQQTGGILTAKLTSIAGTVPFLLMLLVLLFRPQGLMGDKQ